MKTFYFKNKRGFTLVELMVAIAVFSIVMVVAMSALLNVIDANNKARSIKTAVNNISFAIESISKDMRMGKDYACGNNLSEIKDVTTGMECDNAGGKYIKYRSQRAYDDAPEGSATSSKRFAYFKFESTQIWECLEKTETATCNDDSDFMPITSKEVEIENVTFYILGVQNSGNLAGSGKTQPRMIMTVKGRAGSKDKTRTEFNLQTSVSQIQRGTK